MAAMMEQLRCELGCDGLPGSFLAPTVLWRGLFPTGQFVLRVLVLLPTGTGCGVLVPAALRL